MRDGIVRERVLDRGDQLRRFRHLRDPHARPEARRLHEHRQPQPAKRVEHRFAALFPFALRHRLVSHLRHPRVRHQVLEHDLVHAHRGTEHPRAHVGNVRCLQQPLHGAVLSERAVQHGEDHVRVEETLTGQTRTPAASSVRHTPSRPITTVRVSWPARSNPSTTERPESSDTGCSLERPPASTTTFTVWASRGRQRAHGDRHRRALTPFRPAARGLGEHCPVLVGLIGRAGAHAHVEAGVLQLRLGLALRETRHVGHLAHLAVRHEDRHGGALVHFLAAGRRLVDHRVDGLARGPFAHDRAETLLAQARNRALLVLAHDVRHGRPRPGPS